MKLPKTCFISIALYILGFFIALISIVYWQGHPYLMYALIGTAIGLGVMLAGYLYNWIRNTQNALQVQERRIDAIVNFFMKREQDANLEEAKGE